MKSYCTFIYEEIELKYSRQITHVVKLKWIIKMIISPQLLMNIHSVRALKTSSLGT